MKIPNFKLGATNRFPEGKTDEHDEGELQIAVIADHHAGIVRLMFGKRITWIGLPAQMARDWAKVLIEKADELDKRKS